MFLLCVHSVTLIVRNPFDFEKHLSCVMSNLPCPLPFFAKPISTSLVKLPLMQQPDANLTSSDVSMGNALTSPKGATVVLTVLMQQTNAVVTVRMLSFCVLSTVRLKPGNSIFRWRPF